MRNVAREFNIAHSIVSKLWAAFQNSRICTKRTRGSRPKSTTSQEDYYIVISAKMNRRNTAGQLANQLCATTGTKISLKTAARRLING